MDEHVKCFKGSRSPVRMKVDSGMSVKGILEEFAKSGYNGKRLGEAFEVYKKMMEDKSCYKFVSAAGALISGGMREVFVKFIRSGAVDCMLFTGAILTHDLMEAFGAKHYQGELGCDDRELHRKNVIRIYDVFLDKDAYSNLEDELRKVFDKIKQEEMSPREFLKELGGLIKDENSILKACADMDVDIYCPSITDSMLGFHAWVYSQNHGLKINCQWDIRDFMDVVWGDDKSYGMLILGGGVPKHFVPGMMQASGNSLKYVIQITMDRPEHGGVSGMQIIEAKSWGKVAEEGLVCDLRCDVTVAFPILVAGILDYLKEKN